MSNQPQSRVCARPGCETALAETPKGQRGRKKKYCKPECQVEHYNAMHPRIDLSKMTSK